MSRENKWERRHTEEDERPSGRWRDEVGGGGWEMMGGRPREKG